MPPLFVLCIAGADEPYVTVWPTLEEACQHFIRLESPPNADTGRWFIERQVPGHPEATEQVASSQWDEIDENGRIRGAYAATHPQD